MLVQWGIVLTWIRQDGVSLRQKLVTADSLVAFSTPSGEKRKINSESAKLEEENVAVTDANARAAHKRPPVSRQI